MTGGEELQIYMLFREEKWFIVLEHADGREEISHKSFKTKQECSDAIAQYVKDRNGEVTNRVH